MTASVLEPTLRSVSASLLVSMLLPVPGSASASVLVERFFWGGRKGSREDSPGGVPSVNEAPGYIEERRPASLLLEFDEGANEVFVERKADNRHALGAQQWNAGRTKVT